MKMSNQIYDVLKFIAQIVLPAVATLYTTVANIWGLPLATEVGATIMAVDTFLGAVLMISTGRYNSELQANGGTNKYNLSQTDQKNENGIKQEGSEK